MASGVVGEHRHAVAQRLRPNDLIWPYVVNDWLLGKDPPAFDILYWNADTTRLPAALHREFITIATENSLRHPGGVTVLGTPVDLSRVTVDSYLVAGIADHITPWQNCYRTTQLLGGTKRFVLSTSGHIAAIVNPPGNKRATYRTADTFTPPSADEWLARASMNEGTWWADWDIWLRERAGDTRAAPVAARQPQVQGAGRGARRVRARDVSSSAVNPHSQPIGGTAWPTTACTASPR
jgi:poly[(R)-3-hydroxyalkanoate] polymerase subunit PhaC